MQNIISFSKIWSVCLVPLFVFLFACSNRQQSTEISSLDSIANSNPKLALAEINKKERQHSDIGEKEKMRVALIKYKAEDKCYVVHESDSTIKNLTDFFSHHGSFYEKLQSFYYMGSTYRDMKDYPLSIMWYDKAIELAESNQLSRRDSSILSLVHSQMADAFYRIGDNGNALKEEQLAYKIQLKLGTATISTFEDMGRFYDGVDKKDSAAYFYKKALVEIINQEQATEYIDYLGEQLGFYTSTGMTESENLVFSIIKNCKSHYKISNVYTAIASYYAKRELTDSAFKYFREALELENRPKAKAYLTKNLAEILSKKGDLQEASKYAMLSLALSDSADAEANANGVVNAKNQMTLAELQNSRTFKKETKQRSIIYTSIFIIIVLFLVSAFLLLLVVNSRRKLKYQLELQKLSNEKDKIVTDNLVFRKKVMTDRQLRAESAPDISMVINNLQDLADSQKLRLRPDSWDIVFNAVDKLHPDFRGRLLSYNHDLENKDLILLYLMKLGFKQADVSRIIKRSPSVVSRKLRRIERMLGTSVKDALR